MSTAVSADDDVGCKYGVSWQHTMIRVKDPEVSVPFYEKNFGMRCIHSYRFSNMGFSSYFLESAKRDRVTPEKGSKDSETYLWTMEGACLELLHNHGTEVDDGFKVNNGNVEPYRGFGHIAFNTDDVYDVSTKLEADGIKFQKRPDEGRMKGLAFALDPDGYWIEIISRSEAAKFDEKFNLSQTMLRVKDPVRSLKFYTKYMGMTLIREANMGDFSLYFLATIPKTTPVPDPKSAESREFVKSMWNPVLELTHNHGTEKDENFAYHSGNEEPQGYGHTGFICDDVWSISAEFSSLGIPIKKKLNDGKLKNVLIVADPDNYSVVLVQRNSTLSDEIE